MRDRLRELRQYQASIGVGEDTAYEFTKAKRESDDLEKFFQLVQEVHDVIDSIAKNVLNVKKKQSDILSSTVPDEKLTQDLEKLTSEIKLDADKMPSKLKLIDHAALKNSKLSGADSADLRIKRAQQAILPRLFIEVMEDYNTAQNDYREKCKVKLQRQLRISGKHVSNEELERMLEGGACGSSGIFTGGIMVQTLQARQRRDDIVTRRNDIVKLEKSILELRDLFLEMARLTEEQGDFVNNIERTVNAAGDYIEKTKIEIKKGFDYRRRRF